MTGLTLRNATPDDSEFAFFAKKAGLREYVEQVWGWREEEQRRLHAERFAAQDYRVVVLADKDFGIVAIVRGPDCVETNQLFLVPEHQGQCLVSQLRWTRMGCTCVTRVHAA